MIRKFKLYGRYYAIDTASLSVHKLSEMQYDMLRYLQLPFESSFPSTLRYDLAKYESEKLAQAYLALAALNQDGVFLSEHPLTVPDKEVMDTTPEKTVAINENKFIFATEVIKLADSGVKNISVSEDISSPVKKADYDILLPEYERIAKEIIKRRTGRSPGEVFNFLPFTLPLCPDNKGYIHVSDSSLREVLEAEDESIRAKCTECGIAVALL